MQIPDLIRRRVPSRGARVVAGLVVASAAAVAVGLALLLAR